MATARQRTHRAKFAQAAKSGKGKIGQKAAAPTNFKKKRTKTAKATAKKTVRKVAPATAKAALVARLRKARAARRKAKR